MVLYIVRTVAASALRVSKRIEFEVPSAAAAVWIENVPPEATPSVYPIHVGLYCDVKVAADSVSDAFKRAEALASTIVDFLSETQRVAIDRPVPHIAIDLNRAKPDREFGQLLRDVPVAWRNYRQLDTA